MKSAKLHISMIFIYNSIELPSAFGIPVYAQNVRLNDLPELSTTTTFSTTPSPATSVQCFCQCQEL